MFWPSEKCAHVSRDEYEQDPSMQIETLNNEKQNTENQNTSDLQCHKTNGHTRWRNKQNHDWKEDYITIPQEPRQEKVKVEAKKENKLLLSISTANITELIYAGVKKSLMKSVFFKRTRTKKTNSGLEMKLGQVEKLRQQVKALRNEKFKGMKRPNQNRRLVWQCNLKR